MWELCFLSLFVQTKQELDHLEGTQGISTASQSQKPPRACPLLLQMKTLQGESSVF